MSSLSNKIYALSVFICNIIVIGKKSFPSISFDSINVFKRNNNLFSEKYF